MSILDNVLTKNSVLIVDDEPENLEVLARVLQDEYVVHKESDGIAAVRTAKEKRPDVILLDVHMPGITGPDVIATLKDFDETKEIPIIILLDLDRLDEDDEDFLFGAVDYIQKPLPPVVVKSRVRNHMRIVNQKRILDQLDEQDRATGVASIRYMKSRLDLEWRRAVRECTPLSMLVLAVDDFVNLGENKEERNDILKSVAALIKSHLKRPMDLIAHWERGVFIILLPNTPNYGADIVAEMIRISVEKNPFLREEKGEPVYVTVSIKAYCTVPERNRTSEEYLSQILESFAGAK